MARRRLDGERYWREVVREQEASGVSMAAFCRERGLSVTSLYKWRSELKRRAAMAAVVSKRELASSRITHEDVTPKDSQSNSPRTQFVPIELPVPVTTKRAGCEVVLPDGCRVLVPTQCDASWLREILGAIKDQAC